MIVVRELIDYGSIDLSVELWVFNDYVKYLELCRQGNMHTS